MDLHDTWKKLESEKLSQPVTVPLRAGNTSKHPLQKLKNVYRTNAVFIVVFLVCFGILFFLFQEPLVKGSLLLLMLFYLLGLIINLVTYKKLKLNITLDRSVKSILEHTFSSVSRNVRFQERFSLFMYPVAGTAGFFMGVAAISDNFNTVIKGKPALIALFTALIILVPLCYFVTKHLHKSTYGKGLEELKRLITELERPE